jgi:hypothetical protein
LFQASRHGQGCQTVSPDGGEAEAVERPQVLRRRRLNVIRKSFNHFMSIMLTWNTFRLLYY